MRLKKMFKLQREFQKRFFNFNSLSEIEKQEVTNEFIGHLIEEAIELRQELPARKHWRKNKNKPANLRKFKLEYVDLWHWLINIGLVWDFSIEEIYDVFLKKHQVNNDRQDKFIY